MDWTVVIFWIVTGLLGWFLYRLFKNQPQLFSKQRVFQSMNTFAYIALGLTVFVAFLVFMLKQNAT